LTRRKKLFVACVFGGASLIALAAVVCSIIEVFACRDHAPWWDYVNVESYLNGPVLGHGFDLKAAIGIAVNEHRPVFPMIFWIVDHVFFNSNGLFLTTINLLLTGAIAAVLGMVLWRCQGLVLVAKVAFLLLTAVALFWPAHWENLLLPMQILVSMSIAASLVGFAGLIHVDNLLRDTAATRKSIAIFTALALASLFVGMFSFGSGLVAWFLIVPLIVVRSWPSWLRNALIIVVVLGLALYGSLLINGLGPEAHTANLNSLMRPFALVWYVFTLIGAPARFVVVGLGGRPDFAWAATAAGAFGIAALGAALMIAISRKLLPTAFFFLSVAVWAVGTAVLTANGRVDFASPAVISRYLIIPVLFWLSLGGWILASVAHAKKNIASMLGLAVAGIALLIVSTFPYYFGVMQERQQYVRIGAISAVLKLPGSLTGYSLFPDDETLWTLFDEFARRGTSVYHNAWSGWPGHPLNALFEVLQSGSRCAGYIERVTPLGDKAAKVAGWAWDNFNQAVPEWLVITDVSGTIVGLAASGESRPDVSTALHRPSAVRSGWTGLTRTSLAGVGGVYAVLNDGLACRLSAVSPQ